MFHRPQNEFAPEIDQDLKELWLAERGLFDMLSDSPTDLVSFVSQCSSAELHQFDTIHGVETEVPVFSAILASPECDRATALNIFTACDPAYFDDKIAEGVKLTDFEDPEDKVMLGILLQAHRRLSERESWRGRFKINQFDLWQQRSALNPANFRYFRLSPTVLRDTRRDHAESSIVYEHTTIGLSFDAWRHRH